MNTIGEIIRAKREKLRLSQERLAEKIGVHSYSVIRWEKGDFYPSVLTLCDLADFFGCTTDELLGRKNGTER